MSDIDDFDDPYADMFDEDDFSDPLGSVGSSGGGGRVPVQGSVVPSSRALPVFGGSAGSGGGSGALVGSGSTPVGSGGVSSVSGAYGGSGGSAGGSGSGGGGGASGAVGGNTDEGPETGETEPESASTGEGESSGEGSGEGSGETETDAFSDSITPVQGSVPKVDLSSFEEDDSSDLSSAMSVSASDKESVSAEINFDAEDPSFDITDEDSISYEERARHHANKLLSVMVQEGAEWREKRAWLYSNASPSLFTDENYLLYQVMYKYRNDNFSVDREFIETYFDINVAEIDNARNRINIEAYGSVDGSSARGYAAGIVKHYDKLTELTPPSDEEFYRSYENYLLYYQQIEGARALADASTILEDGMKSKDKRGMVSGFNDASSFLSRKFAEIEGTINRNQGQGFLSLRDAIQNPSETTQSYRITDFGDIDELNDHYGGIQSGWLITIPAPPKAGKTKFCTSIIHRALVEGKNVTVWPVEGGVSMFQAQLRAIHFNWLYNRNVSDPRERRNGVTQMTILNDSFDTEGIGDLRPLEQASALDLVSNPEYGKMDLIDLGLNLDSFIENIDISVKSNNSSMVMIDYMQLMTAANGMTKQATLSLAYPKLLNYTKKANIATISPAQYSQDSVAEIRKSSGSKDMRTSVGESAEIIRSSDLILPIYATEEDISNNKMTFLSIPTRLAEPIETFSIYADLGTCTFMSRRDDA